MLFFVSVMPRGRKARRRQFDIDEAIGNFEANNWKIVEPTSISFPMSLEPGLVSEARNWPGNTNEVL